MQYIVVAVILLMGVFGLFGLEYQGGLLLLGFMAITLAEIFLPRLLPVWRVGWLTSIGLALMLGGAGVGCIGYASNYLVIPLFLGAACAVAGQLFFRKGVSS